MGFHENLRHYREKKGYTTKEIADLLGIAPNTYAGYEIRGREPKYNTLCKIADLLHVSTDELLGRENNILGMNEDERLKKELDNLLNPSELKTLKISIDNIDDKYVYFSLVEIGYEFTMSKDDTIKVTNKINDVLQKKKKNIFQKSLLSSILFKIILCTDKQIDELWFQEKRLSKKQKDKLQQLLNIQNEVSSFLGIDKQIIDAKDNK